MSVLDNERFKKFANDASLFLPRFFERGFESATLVSFLRDQEGNRDFFDFFVESMVRKAFDSGDQWVAETIGGCLVVAVSANLIDSKQVCKSFEKLFHILDDLALDVPTSYAQVFHLVQGGVKDKILPPDFECRVPINVLRQLDQDKHPEVEPMIKALDSFRQSTKKFLEQKDRSCVSTEFWSLSCSDAQTEIVLFLGENLPKRKAYKHEFLRFLIHTSMSKSNTEREIVSSLLCNMTGESSLFSPEDVVHGFMRIFAFLPDSVLDIPNVAILTAKFLARAVVDEVLPPSFLGTAKHLRIGGAVGSTVLDKVISWIDPAKRRNLSKYEDIWRGSDVNSEVAIACRRKTRELVYSLFQEGRVEDTAITLSDSSLTPDLAVVCVRVVIECLLEQELDSRVTAIGVALIQKLKEIHEVDGQNILDAIDYLETPERESELIKDVGINAHRNLETLRAQFQEQSMFED